MARHGHEASHAPVIGHAPPEVHEHPTAQKYIWIAVILTVITAVEVAVFYIEAIRSIMVPVLGVLAIAKFVLVVGYYMHLKFDSRVLTWLFVAGLVVAIATITGLWALFNGWGG